MNFLKDYDCKISYHPGKENMVVDALSRKTSSMIAKLIVSKWKTINFTRITIRCSEKKNVYSQLKNRASVDSES